MKKIAFFIQNGVNVIGGAERILSIIASELANNGYEIIIISNDKGTPAFDISPKIKIMSLGMTFGKTKLIRRTKPIFYIPKLRKILKSEKVDILIPLMSESAIMSILSRTKGLKIYPWIHDSYYAPLNLQDGIFRKYFLGKIDRLIVLNTLDYKAYSNHIKNITRIPNPSYFKTKNASKLDNKVIISAGRLDEIKGFDSLIKAFKNVSIKHPDWKLKIFGADWGEKEKLEKLILDLELEGKAFLMGAVSNIQEEYLKADIYAMTSKFECFPMVLLEAKECGLPVVTFDCKSGPRDIVKDNIDGFLVEPENIELFSDKLLELIENKEKLIEFGKAAKENIKEFELEKIIEKWKKLLDQ